MESIVAVICIAGIALIFLGIAYLVYEASR